MVESARSPFQMAVTPAAPLPGLAAPGNDGAFARQLDALVSIPVGTGEATLPSLSTGNVEMASLPGGSLPVTDTVAGGSSSVPPVGASPQYPMATQIARLDEPKIGDESAGAQSLPSPRPIEEEDPADEADWLEPERPAPPPSLDTTMLPPFAMIPPHAVPTPEPVPPTDGAERGTAPQSRADRPGPAINPTACLVQPTAIDPTTDLVRTMAEADGPTATNATALEAPIQRPVAMSRTGAEARPAPPATPTETWSAGPSAEAVAPEAPIPTTDAAPLSPQRDPPNRDGPDERSSDQPPDHAAASADAIDQGVRTLDAHAAAPASSSITAPERPPATATTHASAPPAPSDQIADRLAPVMLRSEPLAEGGQRLTIRLDPVELGQVEVRIDSATDETPRIRILVERPETLALLRRDQQALEAALDRAGLGHDSRDLTLDLAPREAIGVRAIAEPAASQERPAQSSPWAGPGSGDTWTGDGGRDGRGTWREPGRPSPYPPTPGPDARLATIAPDPGAPVPAGGPPA